MVVGLLVGPAIEVAPALASCASTPSLEDAVSHADVVFVGTVVSLANRGRWATVKVEERWRGAGGLSSTIEVRSGGDPGVDSPTDRTYQLRRYLFTIRNGPGYLVDDACSATTPWTGNLARLRPEEVEPAPGVPSDSSSSDSDLGTLLSTGALFAALGIAVIAYLIVLRARRRPADWIR